MRLSEIEAIVGRIMTAVEKAQRCGTLHEFDRSRQYQDQASNAELLEAVNQAWTKIRLCERSITLRDAEILALKETIRRDKRLIVILTSILTSPAWIAVVRALIPYVMVLLGRS